MDMADRIQQVRKTGGLSQEEFADRLGVSRQAVSKWESGQSVPDAEKIVRMSEVFGVTTDYLLKGVRPAEDTAEPGRRTVSRILYIAAAAFVVIGLLCAFGGWYAEQSMEDVWGGMVIQAVGAAAWCIGRTLSAARAPLWINWLCLAGAAFMPISLLTGLASGLVFHRGWAAPYPDSVFHALLFCAAYPAACLAAYAFLKKRAQAPGR